MLRVALLICLLLAGCRSSGDVQPVKENAVHTTVSRDGTKIGAVVSGEGPPLVLVHGTTADHTRWAPILPQLQEHFTVYAMDRRGRGHSGDADNYDVAREFEDIAALVNSIGEPVSLLAHSYGALCSLEASLLARNLRKLVLYEPPIPVSRGIYSPGALDRLEALLATGDNEAVVTTFFREVVGAPPEELAMLQSLPNWPNRVAAAHTLPRELRSSDAYKFDGKRWREMRVPTLLLLGGDSPEFFHAATNALQDALPDSRVAVLPGQQHTAMNTAPEMFISEVLAFLRG
jgi:pimeloyl-ACP methyl ester carboxylesterase